MWSGGVWAEINLIAECGPMSEGGLVDLEPLLSRETMDAIEREAGEAIVAQWLAGWGRAYYERREPVVHLSAEQKEENRRAAVEARDRRHAAISGGNVWCVGCGTKEDLTIDHIVATANGGTNARENLQLLCRPCNSSKGSLDMDEWLARRAAKALASERGESAP